MAPAPSPPRQTLRGWSTRVREGPLAFVAHGLHKNVRKGPAVAAGWYVRLARDFCPNVAPLCGRVDAWPEEPVRSAVLHVRDPCPRLSGPASVTQLEGGPHALRQEAQSGLASGLPKAGWFTSWVCGSFPSPNPFPSLGSQILLFAAQRTVLQQGELQWELPGVS